MEVNHYFAPTAVAVVCLLKAVSDQSEKHKYIGKEVPFEIYLMWLNREIYRKFMGSGSCYMNHSKNSG